MTFSLLISEARLLACMTWTATEKDHSFQPTENVSLKKYQKSFIDCKMPESYDFRHKILILLVLCYNCLTLTLMPSPTNLPPMHSPLCWVTHTLVHIVQKQNNASPIWQRC